MLGIAVHIINTPNGPKTTPEHACWQRFRPTFVSRVCSFSHLFFFKFANHFPRKSSGQRSRGRNLNRSQCEGSSVRLTSSSSLVNLLALHSTPTNLSYRTREIDLSTCLCTSVFPNNVWFGAGTAHTRSSTRNCVDRLAKVRDS